MEEQKQVTNTTQENIIKERKKQDRRKKINAYYRAYYQRNKDKYNKNGKGLRRGQRGGAKQDTYKLSILDDNGEPIISQKFKSLIEIAKVIKVKPPIASLIHRGRYLKGKAKTKKTKNYEKFLIQRIR
tara:strand:- start:1708 stop:2091 length:384 start_codon:yes stop_codon:yes gene_type:complete